MKGSRTTRGVAATVVFAVLALVAVAGTSAETTQTKASYTLRLGTTGAVGVPNEVGDVTFAKEVERLTHGEVTVEVHPNSELGNEGSMLTQLQNGALDFADVTPATLSGQFPQLGLYSLPGLVNSFRDLKAFAMSKTTLAVQKGLGSRVVGLYLTSNGPLGIIADRAVQKASDAGGMKLRTLTDPITAAFIKGMKATVVPMDFAQVYSALQQHVIQGCVTSLSAMVSQKLYEVANVLSQPNAQWNTVMLLASQKTLARLPARDQAAIFAAARTAQVRSLNEMVSQTEAAVSTMKSHGVKVVSGMNVASFVQAGKSVWPQFVSKIGNDLITRAQREIDAPTRLVGSVSAKGKVTLAAANGYPLNSLSGGPFVIAVKDASATRDFHLTGPGFSQATGVKFRGTTVWKVTLKPGKYSAKSDGHAGVVRFALTS